VIRTPARVESVAEDVLRRLNQETPPAEVAQMLDEPYPLSRDQVSAYQAQGHVKIPEVLTGAALDYYRELLGAAVAYRGRADERSLPEKTIYEQSFLQIHTLGLEFESIRRFVHASRFAGLARQLMQVDGVRYYFDQALYKEPGGRLTDYHQDSGYWPVEPALNTTTIWLALVDVDRSNGCMAFARGSHRLSDEAEFVNIFTTDRDLPLEGQVGDAHWDWVPLEAGDCTFHSGLTYHRAGPNQTDEMREAMTIAYMAHDAVYDWPESNRRLEHWGPWAIKGLKRGDRYTNPTTPRLL
jgi:hypothetical protein